MNAYGTNFPVVAGGITSIQCPLNSEDWHLALSVPFPHRLSETIEGIRYLIDGCFTCDLPWNEYVPLLQKEKPHWVSTPQLQRVPNWDEVIIGGQQPRQFYIELECKKYRNEPLPGWIRLISLNPNKRRL